MAYESAHERAGKLQLLRRAKQRAADIRVDLGEQDLKFKVCGSCYSLVLPEHWDRHVAWHERLAARWRGKKTGE